MCVVLYCGVALGFYANRKMNNISPLLAILFAPSVVILAWAFLQSMILTLIRGGVSWRGCFFSFNNAKKHHLVLHSTSVAHSLGALSYLFPRCPPCVRIFGSAIGGFACSPENPWTASDSASNFGGPPEDAARGSAPCRCAHASAAHPPAHIGIAKLPQLADFNAILPQADNRKVALLIRRVPSAHIQKPCPLPPVPTSSYTCALMHTSLLTSLAASSDFTGSWLRS